MKNVNPKMKGMLALVLLFSFTLFSYNSFAQTKEEATKLLKQSDVGKLKEMQKYYSKRYQTEKQKAIEVAREKGWIIRKELEDGTIIELQRIGDNGQPIYYMTDNINAANTLSTNEVWEDGGAGLGLTGKDMIIGEWDGGAVLKTHQEFVTSTGTRIVQKDDASATSTHATHVAGTMIAAGVDPDAKGMAYEGTVYAHDMGDDNSEMIKAGMEGLLVSNHSYGRVAGYYWNGSEYIWVGDTSVSTEEDYGFGFYGKGAEAWDSIAHEMPYYLIVKSAGNDHGEGPSNGDYEQDGGDDGYDCIGWTGNAKNILTVGAVEDMESGYTGNPSDVTIASFSSRGPSDDGRIKPDICGNGTNLYSSSDAGSDEYTSMSGTSMSGPNVTGSLILLQEHWKETQNLYMRAATLKGLVIHTADEAGDYTGPDYIFGWGLMNTQKAAQVISDRNVNSFIKENKLNEGDSYTFSVEATGDEPLVVTLSWTDPAGTPTSPQLDPRDKMLVNDLDVTVSDGSVNYQPYMLDPENPSDAPTTGDNNVDNVEKVYIESPSAGTYTLTVDHDGSLTNSSQEYSLVITGVKSDFSPKTDSVYKIGQDTAIVDAEIKTNSKVTVTERGIAYATTSSPTVSDNATANGSGTGLYTTTLKNLTPYSKYYIRAYAKTENGVIYGNTKTFNTLPWDVDASIDSLTNPVKMISIGDEEIRVNIKNIGFNNLTSLDIDWSIDGVSQTTANWTGDLKQDSVVEVSIGTFNFSSTGDFELLVDIKNANGITDPNTENNTIQSTIKVIEVGQLFEDFESTVFLPKGWSETGNAVQWERASDDFFVQIDGFDAVIGQDINDPAEKLITPPLAIDGSSSNIQFSMAGGNNTYSYGSSKIQLKYSSDDGSTWNNLGSSIDLANYGGQGADQEPKKFSYQIDTLTPGTYLIAFEASSDFDYSGFKSWLVIDNISGPARADLPANDLMVNKRRFPNKFVYEGETIKLPIEISNAGTAEQSNINVSLYVDNTLIGTKTINKTLGYIESAFVEFDWIAEEGIHEFVAAIDSDENTGNDTIKFTGSVTNNGLLTEGFENEMPPAGWELDSRENWSKKLSDWPPHWSGNSAAIAANVNGFSNAILATRKVQLSGEDTLSFYANAGNLSIGNIYMDIVYSKDKQSWTKVGSSIHPTEDPELYVVDLSSVPAGKYFLGFRATGEGDGEYSTVLVLDHVIGPTSKYYKLSWKVDDGTNPVSDANVFYTNDGSEAKQLTTDSEGFASITVAENSFVEYIIAKENFESVQGDTILTKDDTLSMSLDAGTATWPVIFKVTDASTKAVMENIQVTFNGVDKTTDTTGKAMFMAASGDYDYEITIDNYESETGSITVSSNMVSKTLALKPLRNATFTVIDQETSNPLEGAQILINNSDLTADADGKASILLAYGSHDYTATAAGYDTLSGTVNIVDADITEAIELAKETFTVKFQVTDTSASSPVAGATVTLTGYGDTTTNNSGIAEFYNVAFSNNLDYSVTASDYDDASGTISTIDQDTTIAVAMKQTETGIEPSLANNLTMYPNPTSGNITIEGYNLNDAEIKIRNIIGELVHTEKVNRDKYSVNLNTLPEGIYLIEISKGSEQVTKKIIIK